jgi:hypothetical protein
LKNENWAVHTREADQVLALGDYQKLSDEELAPKPLISKMLLAKNGAPLNRSSTRLSPWLERSRLACFEAEAFQSSGYRALSFSTMAMSPK